MLRIENVSDQKKFGAVALIMALNKWLHETGVSKITAWRWRKRGWLKTVNVSGRVYVTAEGIAEFMRRAEAGEFAAEHKAPTREGA